MAATLHIMPLQTAGGDILLIDPLVTGNKDEMLPNRTIKRDNINNNQSMSHQSV